MAKRGARSLRRQFVTPEGVDLALTLGTAGARAGAFIIDLLLMAAVLIAFTVVVAFTAMKAKAQVLGILWLLGFFILRFGWFSLFEAGGRGATPGKRIMGLRVVARDGARLTGGAVLARNAMREIEVFLPLSFLAGETADGGAGTALTILSLLWSGIFLFFPLFNRDRLRVGDIVAGTWVVEIGKAQLAPDLVSEGDRQRRQFSEAALDLYGVHELQTLEEVLRQGRAEPVAIVADAIRRKAGLPDDRDDYGFLSDYYAALCARLERGMLVGQRREDKHERSGRGKTSVLQRTK